MDNVAPSSPLLHLMEEKEFYSIDEVATKLNISIKSVRRMVASGELKSIKIRNLYRISKDTFEEFLHSHQVLVTSTPSLFREEIDESILEVPNKRESKTTIKKVSRSKTIPASITNSLFADTFQDEANWKDISSYWNNPTQSSMTFVDLFCGAGGLSKGLEMSGLQGICGLDWFKEACMTYNRNFHHPFVNGDIKDPNIKQKFYDTVKNQLKGRPLNIVAGGFPCQGFSMAGNRIVDDPRNSLYLELIEIVKHLQPEFVICENVKGLRSMLDGKVEQKILDDFRAIGYEMNVTTLCAADYFTPQKRERVIFIGNRIGKKNYHPKPILKPSEYITTGQSIGDLIDYPEDKAFNHVPTKHRPDMAQRMLELPEGQSLYKGYSDAWKKCPWNEASCTIKENHGGVNIHPKLPRVLTAREMARLQSFPDEFIFEGPKNKQLVQIGNAVPPLLGKAIGLAVRYSNDDL